MRVLVTGTINRPDILIMFQKMRDHALFFVEYASSLDANTANYYKDYGPVESWRDFPSADALLDEIRPDRVVLLFNTSFNQVALRLAAKRRAIPVVHLEHGFRLRADTAEQRRISDVLVGQRRVKRFTNPLELFRNNAFLLGSLMTLRGQERVALLEYLELTYFELPNIDNMRTTSTIRRCDAYLAYSPEIFRYHQEIDEIGPEVPVHFTGVPQFDPFRKTAQSIIPSSVLLIDHQYANAGHFGWNLSFREQWAKELLTRVEDVGRQLYVKTHPEDRSGVWDPYVAAKRVQMIDSGQVHKHGFEIITGALSTLLLPLAAQDHTTLLTLEIHPEPGHFASAPLVDAGIAEPCFSWAEFSHALITSDILFKRQFERKALFIPEFLFVLDGKSGDRVRRAILNPFLELHGPIVSGSSK